MIKKKKKKPFPRAHSHVGEPLVMGWPGNKPEFGKLKPGLTLASLRTHPSYFTGCYEHQMRYVWKVFTECYVNASITVVVPHHQSLHEAKLRSR